MDILLNIISTLESKELKHMKVYELLVNKWTNY